MLLESLEVSPHESPSDTELSLCGASRERVYRVLVLEMELHELDAVRRRYREEPERPRSCMICCLERSIWKAILSSVLVLSVSGEYKCEG